MNLKYGNDLLAITHYLAAPSTDFNMRRSFLYFGSAAEDKQSTPKLSPVYAIIYNISYIYI